MSRAKAWLALASVAVLALGGCGGGDDATTTTTTLGGSSPQPPDRDGKAVQRGSGDEPHGEGKKKQPPVDETKATAPQRAPTGAAPTLHAPLPNEGTKEPAPGVPLAKGGENGVQTYGLEAPSAERIEAARTLQAFLDARAAHDWQLACSYLSDAIQLQIEESPGMQSQKGETDTPKCVGVMEAFAAGVPNATLRSAADIRVLSMRSDGDQAILIYKDGEGAPSTIPMNRESGSWRVSAIAGSALFLGVP